MAKQTINIGSVADDGTGDPLRTAFDKTNDNFNELYGGTYSWDFIISDYVAAVPDGGTALPFENAYLYAPSDNLAYCDLTAYAPTGTVAIRIGGFVYNDGSANYGAIFTLSRSAGTPSSPSALTSGRVIGRHRWETYHSTGGGGEYYAGILQCVYSSAGTNGPLTYFEYRSHEEGGAADSTVPRIRVNTDGGITTFNASSTEATGGSQGAGTFNCKGAYEDGVALGYKGIPQIAGSPSVIDATSVGKHIYANDNVTVNPGVFSAGDAVTIVNSSAGNITINEGSASPSQVTMYLAGTATTGNRTLAQKGIATILCVSSGASPLADVFIISGAGLT